MDKFEAKAREIIAGFLPYIGGPAWNEKAETLIIGALREAVAAERDATIDQCNKIVQLARTGEIDGDYRCISHRIKDLKRDWHDEDGKY